MKFRINIEDLQHRLEDLGITQALNEFTITSSIRYLVSRNLNLFMGASHLEMISGSSSSSQARVEFIRGQLGSSSFSEYEIRFFSS